jgi:outer membrane beta-barrel protein
MTGKFMRKYSILICALILCSSQAFAQEEEAVDNSKELDQIEAEIERPAPKKAEPVLDGAADEKIEDLSGLNRLAPFSEVSVIQRRYQPKTGRFQAYLGLTNIVNDPWFMGLGADVRLAYHLTETWGAELQGSFLSNSERQAIKDLYQEHDVGTSSVVSFKGYTGAALMWTPIYGKMGYFNKRIIPFDMYFSVGAGSTKIDNGSGGSTVHLGTGQTYALSKAMAFRWDFSWNLVKAKSGSLATATETNYNNLLVSLGVSFFFPEAGYR